MAQPSSTDREAPVAFDREELRRLILEAGFDNVGFAAAGAAPAREHFHEWLNRGFAAGMEYLKRRVERRTDPRNVVAGARTVIVVSRSYRDNEPFGIARGRSELAEIASYARGTDYHRVLEKRLKALTELLTSVYPAAYRYYVDTGPVLERDWAQLAGIGWVGKNTCTIDARSGSFLFLGAIITTLAVTPDAPATNHCGSCRRCLDACPTDAFAGPYQLDSRLCISYLNIEHRGAISEELEPAIGNLVFGCDICQEVCPFNRASGPEPEEELAARPQNRSPRLTDLARLDRSSFRERFPRSAIRRAKFEGFMRNVIIALGNSESPACLKALEELEAREDIMSDDGLRVTLERAIRRLSARLDAE